MGDFFLRHSPFKYISLLLLVVSTTSTVIAVRYSRTYPTTERYLSSTAVFFGEIMKLLASTFLIWCQSGSSNEINAIITIKLYNYKALVFLQLQKR